MTIEMEAEEHIKKKMGKQIDKQRQKDINLIKRLYYFCLFLIISLFFGFGSLVFFVLINLDWKISLFFSYILASCLAIMLYDYSFHYKSDYTNKKWKEK